MRLRLCDCAKSYERGSSVTPGPGYFPLGMGVILAVLGLMIAVAAILSRTDDGRPVGPIAWKPLITILLAVAMFGYLLPRAGLVVAMPLLFIMGAFASQEFRWRDAIIGSLLLTLGCWFVFDVVLNLMIPVWPSFIENPAR